MSTFKVSFSRIISKIFHIANDTSTFVITGRQGDSVTLVVLPLQFDSTLPLDVFCICSKLSFRVICKKLAAWLALTAEIEEQIMKVTKERKRYVRMSTKIVSLLAVTEVNMQPNWQFQSLPWAAEIGELRIQTKQISRRRLLSARASISSADDGTGGSSGGGR